VEVEVRRLSPFEHLWVYCFECIYFILPLCLFDVVYKAVTLDALFFDVSVYVLMFVVQAL
jgi:hypothetical protein